MSAPALYLITDRRAAGDRSLVQIVSAVLRGAARFREPDGRLPVAVSLREKDLPTHALLTLARGLLAITRPAGASLFVNGRVDVALAADADGVHLPADGLGIADVRALTAKLAIARSTHTLEEVRAAAVAGADFVVFGPVFDTPSKREFLAPRGLDELERAATVGVPVLALGGITSELAGLCRRRGAHGVAAIRALCAVKDPALETAAFLAALREQRLG